MDKIHNAYKEFMRNQLQNEYLRNTGSGVGTWRSLTYNDLVIIEGILSELDCSEEIFETDEGVYHNEKEMILPSERLTVSIQSDYLDEWWDMIPTHWEDNIDY